MDVVHEPGGLSTASAIADLATDWYWQLDENLCYLFHDGRRAPLNAPDHASLAGRSRLSHLCGGGAATSSVLQHQSMLEQHLELDMNIAVEQAGGTLVHCHIVARPILDANGQFRGYRGCGRDITDSVVMQQQLLHMATHDELTGIFNRRELHTRLQRLHDFVQGTRHEFSLCLLDLDRFKLVNDTAGHAAGDRLLMDLVELIQGFLAEGETIARMGGDEFALLLESPADSAAKRGRCMIDAIADYEFTWENRPYKVGACIGITPISDGQGTVEELTDRADSACYAAKNEGRNQCVVFSHDSQAYLEYRAELEQLEMIKSALQANRLRLYMQVIEPSTRRTQRAHYEILLRLESENGELLTPDAFIPVAERFNIMQDLDIWVLEHCLNTLEAFRQRGQEISLSINLSGNTLSDQSALQRIIDTIRLTEVPASLLCFEITETAAISNIDNVVSFMNSVKQEGVQFALDDFGAGLSSFAYIRSLPIDYLKIDGYFIRNIRSDSTNRAITAAFVQLSRDLGIATVAKCVEDKATRRCIQRLGIDFVQGYGVARPRDVDQMLSELSVEPVRKVAWSGMIGNNPGSLA
ncbi:MAG: EAL domain-containing protein [Granulosicoccus sp.]|nr:EAL domain-containing protein [Granulosicoccus sp.]